MSDQAIDYVITCCPEKKVFLQLLFGSIYHINILYLAIGYVVFSVSK